MSEKEIIEGNKLIAEFMGYKYYPNDSINGIKGVLKKKGFCSLLLEHWHKGQQSWTLQYHSSWNDLMPVVEKIEDIDGKSESDNIYINIERRICTIFGEFEQPPYINQHGETKIEATWLAIIRFIKFHNSPH